ncbi:MAG TPA: SDR family NAD(P)-dependent oxidoreductase [Oligoflexus sp.]|uniref:SDR family NAD(P)-dependent oxidoreductase n=1 Tax=Oligoflexus sp. TaxID=1971216 RepID=UPI002D48D048|nr:SDR family NAD(P)-dependent oxidoreductase [Oligoflexus sp.]HYX39088.1 SDR family NAD(P)-dependent oxidoreductase [Oligoflexus sp.]
MQNISDEKQQPRKLQGKVVLITGDDVDKGRDVAVFFAREGADIIINYKPQEQKEAVDTVRCIRAEGGRCFMVPGNLQDITASKTLIEKSLKPFGRIDILINNQVKSVPPALQTGEQGGRG